MANTIEITDASVILALNTPGGPAREWLDRVIEEIRVLAIANSPVNNPLNAVHRGGKVGTYKGSWKTSKAGSNAHVVKGTVLNTAEHAYYVEYGRGPATNTRQRFSWTGFKPPGRIGVVKNTEGFVGLHVLKYATNDTLEANTDFYFPLL